MIFKKILTRKHINIFYIDSLFCLNKYKIAQDIPK